MVCFKNFTNRLKNFFNTHKKTVILIILFLLIFIFLIPLIINGLYQIPAPFPILHLGDSVSVVLEFYGNILSAFLGIAGVFISIQFARKQSQVDYERNSRNSVIPCISVSPVDFHSRFILFNASANKNEHISDESSSYREEALNEIIFILEENGSISFKSHLSDAEKELYFFGKENTRTGYNLIDSLNFPMMISNIGNGSIPFLKISLSETDPRPNVKCYSPSIPLMKETSKTIRICSKSVCSKKYTLDFEYCDVLKNKYKDTYEIKFDANQEGTPMSLSNLSFQELVNH